MDQMLVWALIHDLLSRRNRKRKPPVSGDPFWGDGWGVLRTMWSGLDDRRDRDQIDRCR